MLKIYFIIFATLRIDFDTGNMGVGFGGPEDGGWRNKGKGVRNIGE